VKEKTMNSDSGERLSGPPPQEFKLPRVLDVQIRAIKFEAPRLRNFTSSLESSTEAVEFIVKTDGPIPIRALGPALYVGETAVTEVTEIEANTYRFVALNRRGLKKDAPITLSWTGQPPKERKDADIRFHL
jgi:hypothetical protein